MAIKLLLLQVITVPEGLAALAISAAICYVAHGLARAVGMLEQFITIVTAITVLLATAWPAKLEPLVMSAEGLAAILMQVGCGRGTTACCCTSIMWGNHRTIEP